MKLKVGLRTYKITYKNEIIEVGGAYYGTHSLHDEEIVIANKFSQVIQNEAFLHEMFHAIACMQNLTDLNEDEHTIELLAKGLHMVIMQNPHIFKMVNIKKGVKKKNG